MRTGSVEGRGGRGRGTHRSRPPCRLTSAGDSEALIGPKSQGSPNGLSLATNLQVRTGMHSSTSENLPGLRLIL